jgi:hypothetical protein
LIFIPILAFVELWNPRQPNVFLADWLMSLHPNRQNVRLKKLKVIIGSTGKIQDLLGEKI